MDATGFETRHVSRHFTASSRQGNWSSWPKLTVVMDVDSHFWLGADVCLGPCQDSPQFAPSVRQAARLQPITQILGDKGYDAEHNHRICREELSIPSTIIPTRRKSRLSGNRSWPTTPYRREMKRKSARVGYGQRWQVESSFSRHKRLFGSALRAKTWPMQSWELQLRVLSHNIRLLAAV